MAVIAFDADVLIYSAVPDHPLGTKVAPLLEIEDGRCVGSTLLLPELLIKPTRLGQAAERRALLAALARLELIAPDEAVCRLAVSLGAAYGLKMPDAVHLATAVQAGADVFVTNNRKDFGEKVLELRVAYPEAL